MGVPLKAIADETGRAASTILFHPFPKARIKVAVANLIAVWGDKAPLEPEIDGAFVFSALVSLSAPN